MSTRAATASSTASTVVSEPSTPIMSRRGAKSQTKTQKETERETERENKKVNIVTPSAQEEKKSRGRRGRLSLAGKKKIASPVFEEDERVVEAEEDDEVVRLEERETESPPHSPTTAEHEEKDKSKESSTSFGKSKNRIQLLPQVKKVYQVVNQMTGSLGGNGYNGAIYGELTAGSMQRVINLLVDQCEMDHTSRFIDVGSGLGKPNFHAAQSPGVRLSIGVELETIRWQLAMHNLDLFLNKYKAQPLNLATEARLNAGLNFMAADIDAAISMDPFTHIYMYDLGFPPPLQQSIARKFNNSVHARYLVSYRPPRRVIEEYGFNVEHVARLATSMFGSGEGHTAYFYKRIGKIPSTPILEHQKKLHIPKRNDFRLEEMDIDVYCDEAFFECARLATQDLDELCSDVKAKVDSHLNSSRSKRTTRASTRLL